MSLPPVCHDEIINGIELLLAARLRWAPVQPEDIERTGAAFLPVIQPARDGAEPEILGALYHVDALRALNTALAAAAAEEHG